MCYNTPMKMDVLALTILSLMLAACEGGNSTYRDSKGNIISAPSNVNSGNSNTPSNTFGFQGIAFNNSDVQALTKNFYDIAAQRGLTLHHTYKVLLVDRDSDPNFQQNKAIGVCYRRIGMPNDQILLLDSFWNRATDIQKKALVFHELGHCALDRDHNPLIFTTEKSNNTKYRVSIMYPGMFYDDGVRFEPANGVLSIAQFKIKYWDLYVDQLFANKDQVFASFGSYSIGTTATAFKVAESDVDEEDYFNVHANDNDEGDSKDDDPHCVINLSSRSAK